MQCGRPGFDPWAGKIPWKRKFLPGKSHWQSRLQSMGSQRVGHDWATSHIHILSSTNLPLLFFRVAFAVLGFLYLHMHFKNQLIIFYTHRPVGFCLANIDWFGDFSHLYWAFQIMSVVCLSIYLDILISFNNVLVFTINIFQYIYSLVFFMLLAGIIFKILSSICFCWYLNTVNFYVVILYSYTLLNICSPLDLRFLPSLMRDKVLGYPILK